MQRKRAGERERDGDVEDARTLRYVIFLFFSFDSPASNQPRYHLKICCSGVSANKYNISAACSFKGSSLRPHMHTHTHKKPKRLLNQ